MDSTPRDASAAILAKHAGENWKPELIGTCTKDGNLLKSLATGRSTDSSSAADTTSPISLSSCPSTSSSIASCYSKPDTTNNVHSKDTYRSSMLIAESLASMHGCLDHKDNLELESNRYSPEVAIREPTYHVLNQGVLGGEPTSKPPEHEQQEVLESSVAIAGHQVTNDSNRHAANPSSRSSEFYPSNMTLESSYTLRPDGIAPISGEQAATDKFPDGQQTQSPSSDRIPEPTWKPLNHSGTARPAVHPSPPNDASGISFNTIPHEKNVFSPSQTTTLPRPEIPGPNSMQDQRPHHIPRVGLPPFSTFLDFLRHGWHLPLPKPNEIQPVEGSAMYDPRPRPVPIPTRPLGPPMKPFDGVKHEASAQWEFEKTQR